VHVPPCAKILRWKVQKGGEDSKTAKESLLIAEFEILNEERQPGENQKQFPNHEFQSTAKFKCPNGPKPKTGRQHLDPWLIGAWRLFVICCLRFRNAPFATGALVIIYFPIGGSDRDSSTVSPRLYVPI
jgi:hypothetical protein